MKPAKQSDKPQIIDQLARRLLLEVAVNTMRVGLDPDDMKEVIDQIAYYNEQTIASCLADEA